MTRYGLSIRVEVEVEVGSPQELAAVRDRLTADARQLLAVQPEVAMVVHAGAVTRAAQR